MKFTNLSNVRYSIKFGRDSKVRGQFVSAKLSKFPANYAPYALKLFESKLKRCETSVSFPAGNI